MQLILPNTMQMNNVWLYPRQSLLKGVSIDKLVNTHDPRLFALAQCHQPCVNTRIPQSGNQPL